MQVKAFSIIKQSIVPVLFVSALMVFANPASAEVYDFTYTDTATGGSIVDATGVLVVTYQSPGEYLIDSITGERNGVAITGLLGPGNPVGPDNDIGVDDLLFDPPQVPNGNLSDSNTISGFAYTTADGDAYNAYFDPGSGNTYEYTGTPPGPTPGTQIDFAATATPEPASILLIGGGMAAIGLIRRRRRA